MSELRIYPYGTETPQLEALDSTLKLLVPMGAALQRDEKSQILVFDGGYVLCKSGNLRFIHFAVTQQGYAPKAELIE